MRAPFPAAIRRRHSLDVIVGLDEDGNITLEMERDTGAYLGRSMSIAEADELIHLLQQARREAAEFTRGTA